jgi:hypothetical protein
MARAQDEIGWRMFMEGMVCSEIRVIQKTPTALSGSRINAEKWTVKLITKLLKVTHSQWLYRNVQVHNKIAGTLVTLRKKEIHMEIEAQQALRTAGLLDEDCHLGKCNLGDLKDTLGIKETYWLLAIKAAWEQISLRYYNGRRLKSHPPHRDGHLLFSKQHMYGCKAIRTQVNGLRRDLPSRSSNCDIVCLVPLVYEDSYYG